MDEQRGQHRKEVKGQSYGPIVKFKLCSYYHGIFVHVCTLTLTLTLTLIKSTPLTSHTSFTELTATLSDRSTRASELEVELEVLEGELSAAQQAAKQAPSRSLKGLVERLRGQLTLKEKQQRVSGREYRGWVVSGELVGDSAGKGREFRF